MISFTDVHSDFDKTYNRGRKKMRLYAKSSSVLVEGVENNHKSLLEIL